MTVRVSSGAVLGAVIVLTGICIFLNMLTPFLASINATSCGVETITAPRFPPETIRPSSAHRCRITSKSFDTLALLTVHHDQLTETQLHVTSSRRHVDDQNLEIPSW